jgi:hypothetical protein
MVGKKCSGFSVEGAARHSKMMLELSTYSLKLLLICMGFMVLSSSTTVQVGSTNHLRLFPIHMYCPKIFSKMV